MLIQHCRYKVKFKKLNVMQCDLMRCTMLNVSTWTRYKAYYNFKIISELYMIERSRITRLTL